MKSLYSSKLWQDDVIDAVQRTPILSELDRKRQNQLLGTIRDGQTLITCTGLDDFVDHRFHIDKIFYVSNGNVRGEN